MNKLRLILFKLKTFIVEQTPTCHNQNRLYNYETSKPDIA